MLVHNKLLAFSAIVGAGLVSAQTISVSLSESCTSALKGLLTSPEAACLNPSAFLSFFVGTDKSIPDTIDNWLSGLCASGSCSSESLTAVVTNVTQGCTQDLSNAGVNISSLQSTITDIVQQAYPTARKVVCLKDNAADKLCVTQTLNSLESVIGKLTLDDLSFFDLVGDIQKLLSSDLPNLACTSCTKEAFTIVQQAFPDIVSEITQPVQNVCGASFVDGASSNSVSETAAQGQFAVAVDNSVLAIQPSGRFGLALLLFSAMFVVFM
ncbi:hypothetical protein BDQ12DRAFT_717973 [Crucibulum laeve]|uniref:Uncharacterized protein n=1 Tax=Crucibulum laeve TaxID=68775 RepID=A0A5C3MHE6_9AGAR|nr:hypothetical protein BDQ12DRAFT_717973 [Crucibulum laeve]